MRHRVLFVRRILSAAVAAALLGAAGAPRSRAADSAASARDEAYRSMLLLTQAMEQIRRHYVDADKAAYTNLVHGALRGMLSALDEHSAFLDAEAFANMQSDAAGRFGGVGIVIGVRDGALTVIAPIEDTPAFEAGILAGDRIAEIEGTPTDGMNVEEASRRLRGEPGSRVRIKVVRPRTREIRAIEIVRAIIDVATVKDARRLDGDIAYVRIVQFNDRTAAALAEQLRQWSAEPEPPRALILDLRNNPGGLLRAAVEVAQLFLRPGQIVVSTRGREERERQLFLARPAGGRPFEAPMAILVNGASASASEVVAGALKDHRRAVLIGEKTFGKGSVQTLMPMEGGGALRLTTARYQTPHRMTIHGFGIEPDIVVPLPPEVWRNILRQRAQPDAFAEEHRLQNAEDTQLERAVTVLKGILLYRAGDAKISRG